VYVHNQNAIICCSGTNFRKLNLTRIGVPNINIFLAAADYEEPDIFDLGSSGDSILGAGYSLVDDRGLSAVFFSASHGMIMATPTTPSEQSMLQTTLTGQDTAERSQ
jgi:hypothetical protein